MAKITLADGKAFAPLIRDMEQTGYSWAREEAILRHYPISETTGLPTLPDGYFFRVVEPGGTLHPRIELRYTTVTERKSVFAWLGAKPVISESDRRLEDWTITRQGSPRESIQAAAMDLLQFLPQKLRDVVDPHDFKPFLGDYPPKSVL